MNLQDTDSELDEPSTDDLINDSFHGTEVKEEEYCKIKEGLMEKIEKQFAIVKTQNQKKEKKEEKEADSLIANIKKCYLDLMQQLLVKGYVKESNLKAFHERLTEDFEKKLREKFPNLPNKENELKNDLAKLYEKQCALNADNYNWLEVIAKGALEAITSLFGQGPVGTLLSHLNLDGIFDALFKQDHLQVLGSDSSDE